MLNNSRQLFKETNLSEMSGQRRFALIFSFWLLSAGGLIDVPDYKLILFIIVSNVCITIAFCIAFFKLPVRQSGLLTTFSVTFLYLALLFTVTFYRQFAGYINSILLITVILFFLLIAVLSAIIVLKNRGKTKVKHKENMKGLQKTIMLTVICVFPFLLAILMFVSRMFGERTIKMFLAVLMFILAIMLVFLSFLLILGRRIVIEGINVKGEHEINDSGNG